MMKTFGFLHYIFWVTTFIVSFQAIGQNTPPALSTPIPDQTAVAGNEFNYTIPDSTFEDADQGDELTYSASILDGGTLPIWLNFDPGNLTFSGTIPQSINGVIRIEVQVEDKAGATASDRFNIIVSGVNDDNNAPILENPLPDHLIETGKNFVFTIPENTFKDDDADGDLSFLASQADDSDLPLWLQFKPTTRTFSGTPGEDDQGTYNIKVTAIDKVGAVAKDSFFITVTDQPVGLGDHDRRIFNLYPNPAINTITLDFPFNIMQLEVEIFLYNTHSRLIHKIKADLSGPLKLDIHSIDPGNYFIKILAGNRVGVTRFTKK
ncbi:MAG: putative Ig domain-containing protein [Candidatus Cyclobacteriaceae bacterium M3_2C_046]